MLIYENDISVQLNKYRTTSFIIERFQVAEDLAGLTIQLDLPEECAINSLLIYDSFYNLRAEYQKIKRPHTIKINEEKERSSLDVKHGQIPTGDWFIAFDLNDKLIEKDWSCAIEIHGETDPSLT